jgi:endoglucanase
LYRFPWRIYESDHPETCGSSGPSGYEIPVRELVRAEIEGLAGEVRVDALGNLIAVKGEEVSTGLKIMLSAHMDEIGVIATHIDEKGSAILIGGVRRYNGVAAGAFRTGPG